MKRPYFAYLMPDSGEPQTTRNFSDATSCQSHARAEARVMLRRMPDADLIEIVIVEHKTAVDGMSLLVGRSS